MPKKSLFISLEGTEGAGKTTQMEMLGKYLEKKNYHVVLAREPGGTVIGDRIRKILLNPEFKAMNPITEALLYAASRAQYVAEVIKPALRAGKIVISDRYVDSSYAYQSFGRGLNLKKIVDINNWATDEIIPDLTILFDLPADVGLERIKDDFTDRMEQESVTFHRNVVRGFLKLAKKFPDRYRIIDGTKDVHSVHSEVVKIVDKCL
ncbi:MAG: dTMP kinase [Actinobacteria bacterium]|nr:dTMP kinase [Actinomycetota bacterium]